MIFMIYWLIAGFIAFFITQHLHGRGTTVYDDSYWMIIFGGFISLLSVMLSVLYDGDDEES